MDNPQETQRKKSYRVPVMLIVVWAFIIGLFAYSLWLDQDDENANELLPETTLSSNADAEPVNDNPAVNMTDEERLQAESRDNKRLTDMKMLRIMLESYRDDNGNYPETLDALVPDYLEVIPSNPGPGGQPYTYTGIGSKPYAYYDMSYWLEVGLEGIAPGMHVMSPGGLATP
ncbi:MAG: hypothetical protein WC505_00035 [Patescibacteria group bacterium]